MELEAKWWRAVLPQGYVGESQAGIVRIRHADFSGIIELECIHKNTGQANDQDLMGHAGVDSTPCSIGELQGFHSDSALTERWALRKPRSNKVILVRLRKEGGASPSPQEIEAIIKSIRLKS